MKRFFRFQTVSIGGTVVMVCTSLILQHAFKVSDDIARAIAIITAVVHNFSWHYFTTWKERINRHTLKDYLTRLIHYKMFTLPIDLIVIINFTNFLIAHVTFFEKDTAVNLLFVTVRGEYLNDATAMVLATIPCAIIKFILNDIIVFRMKKIKQKINEVSHHKDSRD